MSVSANPQQSDLDLTMIVAFHHAFRRDLWRLTGLTTTTSTSGKGPEGWEYFKQQVHVHHTVEDEIIWPAITAAVTQPADLAVLQAMDDEHKKLDPAIAAVDQSFGTTSEQLRASVTALGDLLNGHLEHEERDALPMISRLLTAAQWSQVLKKIRASVSIRTAPRLLPWLLAGSTPEQEQAALAILPPPARLLYRVVWRRRYRPNKLWGTFA
jgi:iron-sulfur cluster repair protein YtfE (RIC family)